MSAGFSEPDVLHHQRVCQKVGLWSRCRTGDRRCRCRRRRRCIGEGRCERHLFNLWRWCCMKNIRCGCHVLDHRMKCDGTCGNHVFDHWSRRREGDGGCSVSGAGAPLVSSGARETCSITGAGTVQVQANAGATCSVTGGSATGAVCVKASLRARRHPSPPRWNAIRTTTKLEPDTSLGTQPFTVFFGTLTAPRHRALTRMGLHAAVLPKTLVASGQRQRSSNKTPEKQHRQSSHRRGGNRRVEPGLCYHV